MHLKYPWNDIEVGSYFTVMTKTTTTSLRQIVAAANKRTGKRFQVVCPWKGSKHRQIWRVA